MKETAVNIEQPARVDKPAPNEAQQTFLDALDARMAGEATRAPALLRLSGGPGVGKSFTMAAAAHRAAEAGWCVFLIGPTHQATGVLAAAVPDAFPFEPDPKSALSAGEIMFCTAHKLCKWVRQSRARMAASSDDDPIPRDSWLGRAFTKSWDRPPKGCLVIADETSMYQGQMSESIWRTLQTLQDKVAKRVVFVAVGDPDQLTPVRGPSYEYVAGEAPGSPSLLVTAPGFEDHRLTENMRAKDSALRDVVQAYRSHRAVPAPPPGSTAYTWADATPAFFERWADKITEHGAENCVLLGYRRAAVASANDMLSRILHDAPSSVLQEDRLMRVQQTYNPRRRTLAASSDLVRVTAVHEVGAEILDLVMPPVEGFEAAHDVRVRAIVEELIQADLETHGPYTVADVIVQGDRAGVLNAVPVQVASEHEVETATQNRWAKLDSALTIAAFRRPHADRMVRRGLASIAYYIADDVRLRLEAPYAMTSHRSQGSTYAHVGVLADGFAGGAIVDHRVDSERHASTYVMLSRASKSLTIAWAPRTLPAGWRA